MSVRWSVRSLVILVSLAAIVLAVVRIGWLEPLRGRAAGLAALKSRAKVSDQLLRVPRQKTSPTPPAMPTPSAGASSAPRRSPAAARSAVAKSWEQVKSILAGGDAASEDVVAISFIRSDGGATDADLALIANIPSVEQLDLTHCIVQRFDDGRRITSRNGGAPHVTDAGLLRICNLPRLKYLVASGSQITDKACEAIANLTSLEVFAGNGTAITDEGMLTLARIPSLNHLDCRGTKITRGGLLSFKRLRPDVDCLTDLSD